MSSSNKEFCIFLPELKNFISCSALLRLAKTPSRVLTEGSNRGRSCLASDYNRKASIISPLCRMLTVFSLTFKKYFIYF